MIPKVLKQYAGKQSMLYIGIGSGILSLYLGYNYAFKPWLKERKLRQAEEFANELIDIRRRHNMTTSSGT